MGGIEMKKTFGKVVIDSLGGLVRQQYVFGENRVKVEVHDVNTVINGMELHDFVIKELTKKGFDRYKINFLYQDGNWMSFSYL
jgi:UPF0288 family protein (methanogenesis marker protein 3)